MNDFNYDNEIIEVSDETNGTTLEELIKKETESGNNRPQKNKKRKINLTKQQKIALILIGILIVLLIIGIVLYFVLKKDDETKMPEDPIVIIEKDNYRYENGVLVFLDNNEKDIGKYECTNKDSEKCFVTKIDLSNDTFDRIKNIYENGQEIIKNSKIYFEKYVFVTDGDLVYLYNMIDKETELELKNIKIYNTDENLVVVEDDNSLYGLIEITEDGYEYLIRCSFNNLGIVNTEQILLLAQDKDKNYIVDKTGKQLSKNIKVEVKSANSEFVVGFINDTYNLYNYDFEELISDYDYISLHGETVALVKNKRLYLLNNNLSKLYEDGIRLENTNYIKKYVYNADNRLIETLKSYEIENNNNIVNVTIGDNTKEINAIEGAISSNLSYISYYDGKLYFYSDEEKTDVLSTYTCNNKNIFNTEEDGLTLCNIFVNDLGTSGIYNNEYVFIYDSKNSNDKIYYLYNLKDKKIKGTYSEIQIVSESELGNQIKPVYTSSSFIIAKSAVGNNKGNYGVLEINSEKVQGKVDFKYESIIKNNKYYLLKNIDKTYSIYNNEFVKISNEFENIKLYDKYYVGINGKKLNVYSYTNTLGILENDLSITNDDFEIDFANGFEITVDGKKFNYDKNGKEIINNELENDNITEDENINQDLEIEGDNNGE